MEISIEFAIMVHVINVVGIFTNIMMVWIWGGVDTNGETKAQNKHFPYPWPICPQHLQNSQEDEFGCAIKIGVVSIDEVVIASSFYSTFMWKNVEMCFVVDVATFLSNQGVVAFTTSLQ